MLGGVCVCVCARARVCAAHRVLQQFSEHILLLLST